MTGLELLAISAITGGAQFGISAFGASKKRNQARRVQEAQKRANLTADYGRARMAAYRDDLKIKRHNYAVDRYNEFIPRAMTRAGQAYSDNNAVLKELIDQYQFAGQDRLAQSVAQQGTMAARGMRGRGVATRAVADASLMGRGDALMANNLLRARFGTERANERIRMQLIDTMQNAYNKVGFTPERTPGGLLMRTPDPQLSYNQNDYMMDLGMGALQGLQAGASTFAMGAGSMGQPAPVPPGSGQPGFQGQGLMINGFETNISPAAAKGIPNTSWQAFDLS